MRPIYDNTTFRKAESDTIGSGVVVAHELMENAGRGCADRILAMDLPTATRFLVLAGQGNNGGDGLVIARYLALAGRQVRVVLVDHGSQPTELNAINRERLVEMAVRLDLISGFNDGIEIADNECVIDCIFGSGLQRPIAEWIAGVAEKVGRSGRRVIAIDQPSGVLDPALVQAGGGMVRAHHTLVLEALRTPLFFPETGEAYGQWEVVPIGLPEGAYQGCAPAMMLVELLDISGLLKHRSRFSHKGTHGHALLLAGGPGCYGAALLATKGCARSGVGLITLWAVNEVCEPAMVLWPDVMTICDNGLIEDIELIDPEKFMAIGVGPGMGRTKRTMDRVRQLLTTWRRPMVLDADALNVLAVERDLLELLGPHVVLTPHPKEMDGLLGSKSLSSYDRHLRTREFAMRTGCTVVLKGAFTAIHAPDGRVFINSTGNPGMAKGGSGDVLTGVLAGVLAQGYDVLNACLIAVFLHGLAGDLAASVLGQDAMRASDLADHLAEAWVRLRRPLNDPA